MASTCARQGQRQPEVGWSMAKVAYLVGKVGGRKWSVATVANELGANCNFVSSDGSNHSEHDFGNAEWLESIEFQRECVERFAIVPLMAADYVVAYIDQPDAFGSIAEVAWAASERWRKSDSGWKNHKVLFLYKRQGEDGRREIPDEFDDAYWFTAALPNVCRAEVFRERDASWIIANYLKTQSPIERLFYESCIEGGLATIIEAQRTVQANGKTYRLDFYIPHLNLGIECDGHNFHASKEDRTRDAERDRNLRTVNIEVARFTGTEIFHDPRVGLKYVQSLLGGSDNVDSVQAAISSAGRRLRVVK